jgi:hypothetical protein
VPQFPQNFKSLFSGGLSQLQFGHTTLFSVGAGFPQLPQNLVVLVTPHPQTHELALLLTLTPKLLKRLTSSTVRIIVSAERLTSLIFAAALPITPSAERLTTSIFSFALLMPFSISSKLIFAILFTYRFVQTLPSDSVSILESVIVNNMGWSRPVKTRLLPVTVYVPSATMFRPLGETTAGTNMVNEPELKVIVHVGISE